MLLSELWPGMATKKFQPDRLNSSRNIALDHNGTCGLERWYIWTRTPKDFPPMLEKKPEIACFSKSAHLRREMGFYRTYSARFSMSFFSWLAHFSGKADAFQK